MKYDSLYFLHIPKTGGRYFFKSVVRPIHDKNPNIKEMHTPKEFADKDKELIQVVHRGWIPDITDNTYIASILRDPIKRAVSHYVYTIANRIGSVDDDGQEKKIVHLDKNLFMETIERSPKWHNYSSKNFLYDMSNYKDFVSLSDNDKLLDRNTIDTLFSRVKRTNFLMKTETFKKVDISDISKKISNDLSVDNIFYVDQTRYIIQSSNILYNSLNESDKKSLTKCFELDYEIYNDDSLFWSPN